MYVFYIIEFLLSIAKNQNICTYISLHIMYISVKVDVAICCI